MRIADFIIGSIVAVLLLWGAGLLDRPERVVTKVIPVDRPIERRDTIRVVEPTVQRIYLPQTDTVNVCLTAPAETAIGGLVTPSPITKDGHDLVLTYWRPSDHRWIQETYAFEEPRVGAALRIEGGYDLLERSLGVRLRADARYRNVYLFASAGPQLGARATRLELTTGVGVRLWRVAR